VLFQAGVRTQIIHSGLLPSHLASPRRCLQGRHLFVITLIAAALGLLMITLKNVVLIHLH